MSENLGNTQPNNPISEDPGSTQPNAPLSENLGSTQPNAPISESLGSTQPNIPVKKKSTRGRTFLLNALGLIVVLVLAILAGYGSALSVRKNAETTGRSQELAKQFQDALVDIEFGRYSIARQRLEFIIRYDPTFPGAQETLTQVLVLSNEPAPTVTPSQVPTPDFTGAEQAFLQADQLIKAQDWPGAIAAIDQVRKLDPNYKTSQVDGMYYFALRNYGYVMITKQGNLEGGIYHFTLAERFGPLDREALALRDSARFYLIGASFWELNWAEALRYFSQIGGTGLWDGTMTAGQRVHFASMRYGDELLEQGDPCGAYAQYEAAQALGALDEVAAHGFAEANRQCYPATEAPTVASPVTTEPATEAPTEAPTEVPTEVPTEIPTEATGGG